MKNYSREIFLCLLTLSLITSCGTAMKLNCDDDDLAYQELAAKNDVKGMNRLDTDETRNVSVDATCKDHESPLIRAVMSNSYGAVKHLLEKKKQKADINYPCMSGKYIGHTPLMFAVYEGNAPMVKLLLEKGADPNIACGKGGYTALIIAIEKKHSPIARLLIENEEHPEKKAHAGAICTMPDGNITSPIYWTVFNNDLYTTELLLKNGADPNFSLDENYSTLLHIAISKNNYAMAELLLKHGANPNATNKQSHTPVDILKDNKFMKKLLIENGAKETGRKKNKRW